MKLRDYMIIVLAAGMIFVAAALIMGDMGQQYGITTDTSYQSTYDYSSQINSSMGALQEKLNDIGNSNGWFSSLVSGIAAIPTFVLQGFKVAAVSLGYMISGLTDAAAEFNIPSAILFFGLAALTIALLYEIMSAIFRTRA